VASIYFSYADLTEMKSRVGATDTDDDTELRRNLESASEFINDFCRRHFYVETATRYFDGRAGLQTVLDRYTEEVTKYTSDLWIDDLLSVDTISMDSDHDGDWEDELVRTDYILWPWNDWPKTRIDLDLRQGDYYYWAAGQQAIAIAGEWGYGDGRSATPYASSGGTVTVANASSTSVTASDGDLFAICQTILAGSEQMYITGISADTLTVVRGVNGTTAAAQNAATAYIYRYPYRVTEACLLQAFRWYKRADAPFGVAGPNVFGTQVLLSQLDPDVKAALQPFVRPLLMAV